jgi:parallel beta-helix repeat protein
MKTSLIILIHCLFVVCISCEKDNEPVDNQKNTFDNTDFPTDAGKDTIWVGNVQELMATVHSTQEGNKVVIIKDGVYKVTERLYLTGNNLIYRSESGNRDNVVLKGNGMDGDIGWIFGATGKNFAVKDLTIGEVRYHGIQVHGEADADNFYAQNIRFYNIRQQMIKGTFDKSKPEQHTDNGIVEGCLFEYTSGHSYDYYCGGIDVHHGINWRVSNCIFKNIQTNDNSLTEGGVHFWNNSDGTIVENNTIINCDRGIMFGMDNSPHHNGIIRNNMVVVTKDVGIYLCYAKQAKVYNNSIFNVGGYQNSIECRFEYSTGCEIINNLTNKAITLRNNASADIRNNVTTAGQDWFVNALAGDLHLKNTQGDVTDQALDLQEVPTDFDGEARQEGNSDIGADEV